MTLRPSPNHQPSSPCPGAGASQIGKPRRVGVPQIQNRRLNVQSPIDERRTIKKSVPSSRRAEYARDLKTRIFTSGQSNPVSARTHSIDPQIRKPP